MDNEHSAADSDLHEQIRRLDEENYNLKRLLNTNPDTGLPIRRLFERRLRETFENTAGDKGSVAVAVIRLDSTYDRIKDTRDAGKALLVKTILRMRRILGNQIFQSDRLDEFLCILSSDTPKDTFLPLFEKVAAAVSARHEPPADDISLGCHTGIAVAEKGHETAPQQLMWQAAMALHEAMRSGQGMLYYSQELGNRSRAKTELENDLREQVRNGFLQFYLLLQPIVDKQGTILGAEVLVRWKHPERGLISPNVFIPMAEDNGYIRHIGQWALYRSLRSLADLRVMGFTGYFSVNISPIQFQQPDLVERIQGILSGMNMDGTVLQLELTEGALMQNIQEVALKVVALRALGIRFAIDDFGTGYSSLRYLQDFPVDTIKIDSSFVQGVPEHRNRQEIVRTIQAMASGLGVHTQAEGVETEAERAFLLQQECDFLQGYYFSPPVDLGRFSQLITSGRKLPA